MADRYLASHDASLAAKMQVLPDLDLRMAYIDAEAGEDKYCVLQGLWDARAGGNPKSYYVYERSGGTGTRGDISVIGPLEQPELAVAIAKMFQEKTGAAWGSLAPGDEGLPGKYWLQHLATPNFTAKWQYYVDDGVDGKRTGWYHYEDSASAEVEELYTQHVANALGGRTAVRLVSSGRFKYKVNLQEMTQQNTKTKKTRTICRTFDGATAECTPAASRRRRRAAKARATLKRRPLAAPAMKKSKPRLAVKEKMSRKRIGTKHQVYTGARLKTKGGMRKADLIKNKSGRVVSKKKSERGKLAFKANLSKWIAACSQARAELGLTGFVAIKKGSEFYLKAKALCEI